MKRIVFLACLLAPALAMAAGISTKSYGGREMLVYVPAQLPPEGMRALVVVLHGGLGNAQRIESMQSERGLNLDSAAEKDGFIVAYLNGTPVTRRMGADKLGWNAGGCCGLSAESDIDDVGYIKGAVDSLAGSYGIDRKRVYGIGHSNGAMMIQRLMCETDLFAAGVSVSGPLTSGAGSCPPARGKRILAIHGADDQNVPIAGGRGNEGMARVAYASEDRTRQIFTASGASYDLDIVKGADHKLDDIDAGLEQAEQQNIAQKALKFFGLSDAGK